MIMIMLAIQRRIKKPKRKLQKYKSELRQNISRHLVDEEMKVEFPWLIVRKERKQRFMFSQEVYSKILHS